MRPLLVLGGLVSVLGIALLAWGVRQQVALSDCGRHCGAAESVPVALGILILVAGGFLVIWTLASSYAGRAMHPARHELEEREVLRRTGVAGTARILNWEPAGTNAAGEILLDLELHVEVPGLAAYDLRHRSPAPTWWALRIRVVPVLAVVVDPENQSRVLVEWSRPPPEWWRLLRPWARR